MHDVNELVTALSDGLDDAFKALKDGPVDIHVFVDITPRILRRNKGMQHTTEINLFNTAVESAYRDSTLNLSGNLPEVWMPPRCGWFRPYGF
jgi:hypothetical protein